MEIGLFFLLLNFTFSGNDSLNVRCVGRWTSEHINATAIEIEDTILYLSSHEGIIILNISDPSSIQRISGVNTKGEPRDFYISPPYLYTADGAAGLAIVNISDPLSPAIIGYCEVPDAAWGIAVSKNYAYVATYGSGLRVIDISDPSYPKEIGRLSSPARACEIAVSGNYAYVAAEGNGLRIVDISRPSSPREVGFYDTPGHSYGVAVSGKYAYVADFYKGLRIIDVSNPSSPKEVGFWDLPEDEYEYAIAYKVAVSNYLAYLAHWREGVRVIRVSNPKAPLEIGYYDTPDPGVVRDLRVSGRYIYAVDGSAGFAVLKYYGPGIEETAPLSKSINLKISSNPFKTVASVKCQVPSEEPISLEVYDASGRLVRTLFRAKSLEHRVKSIEWDGKDDKGKSLPSGVYFCELRAGAHTATKKIVLTP